MEFGAFSSVDRPVLSLALASPTALALWIAGLSSQPARPKGAWVRGPGPKGPICWGPPVRGHTGLTLPNQEWWRPLSLLPRPPCSASTAAHPPSHSESTVLWPRKGSHAVGKPDTGTRGCGPLPGHAASTAPSGCVGWRVCAECPRGVSAASLVTKCISIPVKSVYHNVLETVLFVLYCLNN